MNPNQDDFPFRIIETRTGPTVVVAGDIYVNASLLAYGEYSGDELALYDDLCQPGTTVIDAGAHIGSTTVRLAAGVGSEGKVFAFEPHPILYTALQHNLELRGLKYVKAFNTAVGEGTGTNYVHSEGATLSRNLGASFLSKDSGVRVEVTAIDTLELPSCHFAKIDVEGMEMAVLKGGMNTLIPNTILYFENSPFEHTSSLASSYTILSFLAEHGYELFWHLPHFVSQRLLTGDRPELFDNGGSFNVLALPGHFDKRRVPKLIERHDLVPVTGFDQLVFPQWLSPAHMNREYYMGLRNSGDVALRQGDDPSKPWMVLYEAFLMYLDNRATKVSIEHPLLCWTVRGWASAEVWFEHLAALREHRCILHLAGVPQVFEEFLKQQISATTWLVDELIDLLTKGRTEFLKKEGWQSLVVIGSDVDGALELIESALKDCSGRITRISSDQGAAQFPPSWSHGPDLSYLVIEV